MGFSEVAYTYYSCVEQRRSSDDAKAEFSAHVTWRTSFCLVSRKFYT